MYNQVKLQDYQVNIFDKNHPYNLWYKLRLQVCVSLRAQYSKDSKVSPSSEYNLRTIPKLHQNYIRSLWLGVSKQRKWSSWTIKTFEQTIKCLCISWSDLLWIVVLSSLTLNRLFNLHHISSGLWSSFNSYFIWSLWLWWEVY